jgi:hypothetical protein
MKRIARSWSLAMLTLLLGSTLAGCAGHAERAKMGVAWVEAERAQARELARQGFSWGARE